MQQRTVQRKRQVQRAKEMGEGATEQVENTATAKFMSFPTVTTIRCYFFNSLNNVWHIVGV